MKVGNSTRPGKLNSGYIAVLMLLPAATSAGNTGFDGVKTQRNGFLDDRNGNISLNNELERGDDPGKACLMPSKSDQRGRGEDLSPLDNSENGKQEIFNTLGSEAENTGLNRGISVAGDLFRSDFRELREKSIESHSSMAHNRERVSNIGTEEGENSYIGAWLTMLLIEIIAVLSGVFMEFLTTANIIKRYKRTALFSVRRQRGYLGLSIDFPRQRGNRQYIGSDAGIIFYAGFAVCTDR